MPFTERQRFRQPWLWTILLASAVGTSSLMGYGMLRHLVRGRPFGDNPLSDPGLAWTGGLVIALNILLPWLFYRMELEVRVEPDALYIRFPPFVRRKIPYSAIRSVEARAYNPLREYGGWGIRHGRSGKAYNVSGGEGVQLELSSGERLLLGSQHASELTGAIAAQLP